ncbi:MAG: hypothetical protein HZA49_00725 [Planctomycetes bacterium]|nr:hypothetical protein [Planctomycetota bacterium]
MNEYLAVDNQAEPKPEPLFLYIPISRLILLSILSFSLYEFYWIYKNWRYIKEREGLEIKPFWRGFFGIFFAMVCFIVSIRIKRRERFCRPGFHPED